MDDLAIEGFAEKKEEEVSAENLFPRLNYFVQILGKWLFPE